MFYILVFTRIHCILLYFFTVSMCVCHGEIKRYLVTITRRNSYSSNPRRIAVNCNSNPKFDLWPFNPKPYHVLRSICTKFEHFEVFVLVVLWTNQQTNRQTWTSFPRRPSVVITAAKAEIFSRLRLFVRLVCFAVSENTQNVVNKIKSWDIQLDFIYLFLYIYEFTVVKKWQ